MITIQILGVQDSSEMNKLRANVQASLAELGLQAAVQQVMEVDKLMEYRINGIPALAVDGTIVFQKRIPSVSELQSLLTNYLNHASNRFAMKNIIVPTDFSDVSQNAFHFALDLADLQHSEVSAVHVYMPELDPQNPYLTEPRQAWAEAAEKRLQEFVNLDPDGSTTVAQAVKHEMLIGFPAEEIVELSKKGDVDLIVMGSRSDKGVLEKWFGSVSSAVAQKAESPVLLVPPGASFQSFRHILYASDYASVQPNTLQRLMDIAQLFKADVHFVHVKKEDSSQNFKELERRLFTELFKGGEPSFAFTMSEVEGHSVAEALNEYAAAHEIDLMVLACPHRGFWENFFHKSVTKEMALHTQLPVLVLHETQN